MLHWQRAWHIVITIPVTIAIIYMDQHHYKEHGALSIHGRRQVHRSPGAHVVKWGLHLLEAFL